MKNFLLTFSILLLAKIVMAQCTGSTLVISAYIEGSSNNKCIEIFNPTGTSVDLSTCQLARYSNGSTAPTNLTITGTIAGGGFFLICNNASVMSNLTGLSANCATAGADFLNSGVNGNGDDSYVLICGGTVQDGIGVVGEDPGSEWSGGGCSTANNSWFKNLSGSGVCSTFNPVTAANGDYDTYLAVNCGTILTNGGQNDGSGLTCSAGALPVTLTSFEAKPTNQKSVTLTWQTATEENNDYFSIEHSIDGTSFQEIATQAGNGTTELVQDYSFLHREVANGLHYYRLKQVDFDGKFEYTNIVTAKISHTNDEIILTPNPTSNVILIQTKTPYQRNADFQILNMQGQIVLSSVLQAGATDLELNISDFPVGIYYLQLFVDNEVMMKKIIKQ